MTGTRALLLIAAICGLVSACGETQSRATSAAHPAPTADILATVNGAPITATDVAFETRIAGDHTRGKTPVNEANLLENLIVQELAYQRAVALGLESDPEYQQALSHLQVQLHAFQRKTLSEILLRKEINRQAEVSENEARDFFASHADRFKVEIMVRQILARDEERIMQAHNELVQGTSFEDVARNFYPPLPPTARIPWQTEYLHWEQIPEAWREVVYDLKPGEISDVLRGPKDRFWIIQLIERRHNPDVTYENMRDKVVAILQKEKAEELREHTLRELRANANIVYSKKLRP